MTNGGVVLPQFGAEPVLVPVGAVGGHRPERDARRPGPSHQLGPDLQFRTEPRIVLPFIEVPGRGVGVRVYGIVDVLVGPQGGDGDHARSVLPSRPSHWCPTCAVVCPSLRSPASSSTSTPPPCGAVAGSASNSSNLRSLTRSLSHRASDRKNCNRCTAGCCAPTTGSAPAGAVRVLFRSRGASSPARYSRNPRRYASDRNTSSNRVAYPSNSPGATGTG